MKLVAVIFVFVFVGPALTATIIKKAAEDPLVAMFNSLEDKDKSDFLRYFLAMGVAKESPAIKTLKGHSISIPESLPISEDAIQQFQEMAIPSSSISKLVSWTQNEFNMETQDIVEIVVQDIFCDNYGQCISLSDINDLCCPW